MLARDEASDLPVDLIQARQPVLDNPLGDGSSWRPTLSLGAINGCGGLAAGPWPWKV